MEWPYNLPRPARGEQLTGEAFAPLRKWGKAVWETSYRTPWPSRGCPASLARRSCLIAIGVFAMYAVFEDGSRQYRVNEGDVVQLDYRDAEIGTRLEFGRVLLYHAGEDLRIGQPFIDGLRVIGEVVDHPSKKVYVQHFRRRKNYRRLRGHRQPFTSIQILHILLPGAEPPASTGSEASGSTRGAAPATSKA